MSKKKLYDEDGNIVKGAKIKNPFYKRWWFIALVVLLIIGALSGDGDGEEDTADEPEDIELVEETAAEEAEPEEVEDSDVAEENPEESSEEPAEEQESVEEVEEEQEPEVSREFRNALRSAQNYLDIMAFSEVGLFNQLTSEYGDQYPDDAAQYAIENVEVDYNEEALESAQNYQDIMPMSDAELFDQLTSEYGDEFTEEQAQYAIDNLE